MNEAEARRVARFAHADQRDRDGRLHIEHVERVAAAVPAGPARIVALLHDVVEDSFIDGGWLLARGFSPAVVWMVDAISRRDGEDYDEYVARAVHSGPIVRAVKLADARDNLARSREANLAALAARYERVERLLAAA